NQEPIVCTVSFMVVPSVRAWRFRKKVSKQSKVIKQMKGIFLSAAIEKGAIPIGTSFSKMMKMIAKNRNKCLLGLLDKKQ
ncbi:MAG: hypothetical protein K2P73_16645, partial [Lachnospiraceae bacterium]|nr:hypothetical protein [Lachnospiraceae bacterium]